MQDPVPARAGPQSIPRRPTKAGSRPDREYRQQEGRDRGAAKEDEKMKRIAIALAAATILCSPAMAAKIGVSMDKFDDNFLTVLRNGMSDYAKTQPRRDAADRGRQGRRLQADQPGSEFHRQQGRRDHRQPGRHFGDRGDHQGRGRRRRAARLCQPRAGGRRQARPEGGLRRLERGRVRHARDQGDLQAARRQGRHPGHRRPALQPGRRPAHQGHPRRDRDRPLQGHEDRRRADRGMGSHQGAEPDDQLALQGPEVSTRSSPTTTKWRSAPSRR